MHAQNQHTTHPPDPLARAQARYAIYARMMERATVLAHHYLREVRRLEAEDAREQRREMQQARRLGLRVEEAA